MFYQFCHLCSQVPFGRTIRALQARFGEHRRAIEQGETNNKYSVSRHFKEVHAKSTAGLQVWSIDRVLNTFSTAQRLKKCANRRCTGFYP